jgi:Zn-dependent metalloprotease
MKRSLCRLKAWLFLVLALAFNFAHAQKSPEQLEGIRKKILSDPKVASVELSEQRQTPSFIVLNTRNGFYPKGQERNVLEKFLEVRPGIDYLVRAREFQGSGSIEATEFQQYYKGVKVEHASFKAMVMNGNILFFNGSWYDVPASLSTQPSLSEAQGLELAKRKTGARKFAWEQVQEMIAQSTDARQKQALQKELESILPKGELVIVKDFNRAGVAVVRLAWKYNVYAAEPLSRAWIYVDAQNGSILLVDKIIKHANDPVNDPTSPARTNSSDATVQTRYSGTQVIKTKLITGNPLTSPALDPHNGLPMVSSHPTTEIYIPGSSTYVLIDDTRGNGIETYDMNGVGGIPLNVPAIYIQGKSFTDVDNIWTYAEHHRSPLNDGAAEAENDDIAWDAHWGAEVVYDYWLAKHNRRSYDGNDAKIKSFVHYGPAYDNAFWNGQYMTYGDGSGPAATGFKALTSLDVCGHEIGHGVCEFTSNLVYEKESGAMNEGFSDIWAACVEHFAMTRSGSTVPSTAYRPFYIGEQIGANYNSPLRRMDNPKQQGNPDTYGGTNWQNPNCTPNLANDQCGVHTNSGVLNKWFFLMTAGSLNGTRPAGMTPSQYYFADSDDELNDQAETYSVNGLGFDVSEDIAFLTEIMLTSTATYAEARNVSIEVAKALSGDPCSDMVRSVTNSWYAVGVGDAFVTPCVTTYGFVYQSLFTVSEGSLGTACTDGKTLNVPILIPANTTINITTSGTASNGVDYRLSTTTYTNNTGSNRQENLPVFIVDDAIVENVETLVLNVTVPGQSAVNGSYTIQITDDDVRPVIGADSITLINETFTDANATTPFNLPASWTEYLQIPENSADPTASTGLNHWGLTNNKLAITGKLISGVNMPDSTYNNLSTSNTIVRTTNMVDARGLKSLRIKFDYTVQGEIDVASPPGDLNPDNFPKFDYMAIVYSFDGFNWHELTQQPYRAFASLVPVSGTYVDSLPSELNNTQFYLGFRWYNDAHAGGPISVTIDNLTLKGLPRKIENDLGHNGQEIVAINDTAYFYSTQDGEIITGLVSKNNFDFGCVTAAIETAGNNTFTLYGNHMAARKVVRITSTNTAPGTRDYSVALYYTKAQIDNLVGVAGVPASALYMYRVNNTAVSGASSGNTIRVPVTYVEIAGQGGIFMGAFEGGAGAASMTASYTVGTTAQESPLPVNCVDFRAIRATSNIGLTWKVSDERNNLQFEVERSTDGINFSKIGVVPASSARNGQYSFTDASITGLRSAYYRLKQVDTNGDYRYLCTILYVTMDSKNVFTVGNIYPNPGKQEAFVNISTATPRKLTIEYLTLSGQLLNRHTEQVQPGATRIFLKFTALAAGSYMVRFRDEEENILSAQQYMKQ